MGRGLRAELERSVRDQMVSDVPIGAFLSGGVDSSAVVHHDSPQFATGEDLLHWLSRFNGGAALQRVAVRAPGCRAVRYRPREIVVQPDVATLLPDLIWHMEEPISDAAFITTYLVSKFARQDVTVILSGRRRR